MRQPVHSAPPEGAAPSPRNTQGDRPGGPRGRAGGRLICSNAPAARTPAPPAEAALGQRLEKALPLEDLEGRRWWQLTDPYGGLAIRGRQPERNLLLPGGREVLVSARYLRTHP